MIEITKNGNVSVILFTDSDFYLFNSGQILAPLGSLTMVVDKSDMVTFRKAANNDLLFSAKLGKVKINGTQLTKDNAQSLFDEALGGSGGSGGSGIRFVEVQQLPQTGENGIIYLVPNGDTFVEYVWLEDEERFEKLGYDVDLSDYYTKTQVDTALAAKQNTLTFDNTPTQNSTNPVTSGGIYTALQNVQPDLSNYYTKTQVDTALTAKQNTLTFDNTPTENSTNPVTSGGIYNALQNVQPDMSNYYDKDEIDDAHLTISAALNELHDEKQDLLNFDNSPTQNSTNPVTSGGVYTALQNVQPDLSNYYNKTEVDTALAAKQNTLTFDSAPTQNSTNPVTSGGVYTALQNVQPDLSNYYTKTQVDTALAAKQNTLTFDNTPTENSTNPVTSGGVYTALQNVQPDMSNYYDKDEIDEGNRVVSTALNRLNSALAAKQNTLTFDSAPTQNSTNPVTSGGLYIVLGDIDTALATIIGSNS